MSFEHLPRQGGVRPASTPWGPLAGTIATAGIVSGSIAASYAVASLGQIQGAIDFNHAAVWGSMLVFQATMVALTLWLAGWFSGDRRHILALKRLPPGAVTLLGYFLLLALPSLAYTFVIFGWQPEVVAKDMATFTPMINANVWPIYAFIIVIGAPLSEELVFRGFMQSALAQSRLGFGLAGIITTAAWAMLHIHYSGYGLAEIVVVGLFLCWVLWRTGSLWATILLHGLYNGAQFVGVSFRLFPWT